MHGWIKTPHDDIQHVYTLEKYEKNTIPKEENAFATREKKKRDKVVPHQSVDVIVDSYVQKF